MPFRIGIHLCDVIEEEGKIYGDGVNVAALLDSMADKDIFSLQDEVILKVTSSKSVNLTVNEFPWHPGNGY